MTGETIKEMADWAGEHQRTIERRIQRAKIRPMTREAIYPVGTYDKIKVIKMGRPRKTTEDKSKVKPITSKKKK